jgi:hypothetical protein
MFGSASKTVRRLVARAIGIHATGRATAECRHCAGRERSANVKKMAEKPLIRPFLGPRQP